MEPQSTLSFKTDVRLAKKLNALANRSEFIRNALLEAFNSACDFCGGLGILAAQKQQHWDEFANRHKIKECGDCHEMEIQCGPSRTLALEITEKSEILSFKIPKSLVDRLKKVGNRSEFIRAAILKALKNICPWCQGTGVLSTDQKKHWNQFTKKHVLSKCGDCDEMKFLCQTN